MARIALPAVLVWVVVALLPTFSVSDYRLFQLTMVVVYAIAILGLTILTGFNGQISLGHGAFYAIGAYVTAILMNRFDVPYWATLPASAVVCAGVGFLIGLPALRLGGLYLALTTFGLAVAVPQILKHNVLEAWTGGVQGLVIDKPDAPFGLDLSPDQWLYMFSLTVGAVLLLLAWNIVRGRIGRAMMAIRDHPLAAEAMGIDIALLKTRTFALSALCTGIAGSLSAIVVQFVAPDSFGIFVSIYFFVGLVVGGVASIGGAIFGGLFIQFVPNVAENISKSAPGAVYGVILIAVMFLMPGGVAGFIGSLYERFRRGSKSGELRPAKGGIRVVTLLRMGRGSLAALTLALVAIAACDEKNAYVPPPPPQVAVAKPVSQGVTPYLEVTGSAVAYNQVDLVARVEGFLQSIEYKDGAAVKQGDTLFIVEPAPYQSKLQQAQASAQATQADLVQAQAEFTRQSTLGRSDFASQSAVDQARAKRDRDQADLVNQQAGITLAAINYGYTRVTAPFDGLVTQHLVSVGELVGVTSPTKLASIVQLDPIYASFTISEQDVLNVRAAMARRGLTIAELGKIPVEVGLMIEEGYPHKGLIDYVAPMIDPSTGTLTARGILQNPNRALLPGMFLRIRVPLAAEAGQAFLVPDQALGADQGGPYVLVVDKDNVVQQRSVKTGQLVGKLRVIESGVAADDLVVVAGNQRAIPGQKVAPQTTSITADSGSTPGKS